jgi:hypothetical protein
LRSLQEIQLDFLEEAKPKLGCGAKERRRRRSYVNVDTEIVHTLVLRMLTNIDNFYDTKSMKYFNINVKMFIDVSFPLSFLL